MFTLFLCTKNCYIGLQTIWRKKSLNEPQMNIKHHNITDILYWYSVLVTDVREPQISPRCALQFAVSISFDFQAILRQVHGMNVDDIAYYKVKDTAINALLVTSIALAGVHFNHVVVSVPLQSLSVFVSKLV